MDTWGRLTMDSMPMASVYLVFLFGFFEFTEYWALALGLWFKIFVVSFFLAVSGTHHVQSERGMALCHVNGGVSRITWGWCFALAVIIGVAHRCEPPGHNR